MVKRSLFVEDAGTVLAKSYTVWLTILNLILYVADNMQMLNWLPFDEDTKKVIQAILLALIPLARILKQKSLATTVTEPLTPTPKE